MARHAARTHGRRTRHTPSVRRLAAACSAILLLTLPAGIASAAWYRRPTVTVTPFRTYVTGYDTGLPPVTYTLQTQEETLPHQTIRQDDPTLMKGREKVQTKGVDGLMDATRLIAKQGDTIIDNQIIVRYVKTPAVDEIILVGTNTIGITAPTGEMQQWAHDHLLANGYTEEDFTATVKLISVESGWNPNSTNKSSGAYGLPQALPGSVMSSFGDDWQTNYQTQLKWFFNYCNTRYGGIQNAWAYWQSHGWY